MAAIIIGDEIMDIEKEQYYINKTTAKKMEQVIRKSGMPGFLKLVNSISSEYEFYVDKNIWPKEIRMKKI